MNDLVRFAQGVQTATGKKRGRHPVFNSRMFYPYKEELRLQVALKAEISRYIAEAYAVAVNGEAFSDDLETLANFGGDLPEDFRSEVSAIGRAIGRKVSESVARSSEMIVGKPYYPPNAKEEIYRTWEANFQTLCKSAESDAKKEISRIVSTAKNEGWNGRQLEKAIKGELEPKFRHRAELIARTESAKLNGSVTRATYREIGCRYYVWMATMDERTRPDHQAMNGVICSVDDPTVYYTENPDDPLHPVEHQRTSEMCHLHPGDDFQCRCTSVAWDPEIDGQYEVKERPEEPEEKQAEKPEEKPATLAEVEAANERAEKAEAIATEAEKETVSVKAELVKAEKRLAKATEKAATAVKQAASSERRAAGYAASLESMREIASENLSRAEFPDEVWGNDGGVKISKRRIEKSKKSKNEKAKFEKEKNMAQILARDGHTVWLLPEEKIGEKNPDSIVDGLIYDFKHVKFSKIEHRFSEALEQADNVVLRLEGDDFNIQRVFGKLRKHVRNRIGKLILILGEKIVFTDFSDIK